jgi:hypothetical protein
MTTDMVLVRHHSASIPLASRANAALRARFQMCRYAEGAGEIGRAFVQVFEQLDGLDFEDRSAGVPFDRWNSPPG